jgi:type IV secretion system protein VirB3
MDEPVAGFVAPVHRALTEPILMGGAPRSVAIVNGTLAAALDLTAALDRGSRPRFIGHLPPSAAKRDPAFADGAPTPAHFPAISTSEFSIMMNLAEYRHSNIRLAVLALQPWSTRSS